jgi:hypothetical protein
MLKNSMDKKYGIHLKSYGAETVRILAEARQAYLEQKAQGYDREQAFEEIRQAQEEIARQLSYLRKL